MKTIKPSKGNYPDILFVAVVAGTVTSFDEVFSTLSVLFVGSGRTAPGTKI